MSKKYATKTGFTLIELLVVIAIIGVLSGVVLESLNSARTKSRDASRLATVDQINKALELSATGGTNALPSTGGAYVCLGLATDTSPNPCGGTINGTINTLLIANLASTAIPRDPQFLNGVGTAYLYNSNLTPPLGVTTGIGAYLSWVMEDPTTSCGRGDKATTGVANGSWCFLRIGNAI